MDTKLKLEIKDLLQLVSLVVTLTVFLLAFDKRQSLTEQKLDTVVSVVESVNRIANDHEKRIIILEQYR